MKKALIVSLGTTILLVLINFSFSFGYYYVCIDPGHGGSDSATVGPVYGVFEKDANLTVALALKSKIEYYISPVLMTRTIDTTKSLHERVEMANTANAGGPVNYFISVHHNSSSDTSVNGTETYHCDTAYTDSAFGYQSRGFEIMYGARDSTFAKKVRLALRDSLQHRYRCSRQSLCGDTTKPCCMKCWYVLKNTIMQSVLSEASFITNPWVEYQFYHNTNYINKEAGAICEAWWSTYLMGGLGIVKNAYSTDGGCAYAGLVGVSDYVSWNFYGIMDTLDSPYEGCWLMGDYYYLQAVTPQYINGHWRTFHHWAHLVPWQEPWEDPSEIHYEPLWEIMVPSEFDYHRYVAYFAGGPYTAQVYSPNGEETWYVAEQETIKWNASIGADSTTWIDIYLDRNGGNDGYPEHLASRPAAWGNSFPWTVTGPVSAHCKIKIVAEDVAGNSDWDVSDFDFGITGAGNNNPVIDTGLHCRDPYDECNECIKWGESYTLEVNAHDPDGDSIYYEWYCPPYMGGHFSNGQDTMTTAENYVVWTASAKAKAESPAQSGDALENEPGFLNVTVVDVRGGSNSAYGYFEIYDPGTSCLCGDGNGDGAVNIADAVCIVGYLYSGGPSPKPLESGDVNNDCVLNIADAMYIINYLFFIGPLPVCGWICPPDLKTPDSGADDQISGKFRRFF